MACFQRGFPKVYGAPRELMILSAAGSERTISRLKAVLQSNSTRAEFRCDDFPEPFDSYRYKPEKSAAGYSVYRQKMDFDTWHLLAVSKEKGLLPVLSDESLWQELRSERYTTPLLRSWVQWLKDRMLQDGTLKHCDCFQCDAAGLGITQEQLDDLVSEGVSSGLLRIE